MGRVVTKPSIGNIVEQGSMPPSGPPGESRREGGPLRPEPSTPVIEASPTPAPPKAETQPQGFVLLPGGDLGGTARGGAGAAATDHGTDGGGGGREQGGRGREGKGIDGAGSGAGKDGGTGMASGSGGGGFGGRGGVADLFGSIRRQIERAKIYPEKARQAGVEGTVELRFQIGPDGNAAGLEIVRSSGHPELDESALQTIRRAAPYPAVSGRIRIPLSYRLDR
jgi:periplasmic protein TonB